ncbi:hypothetical protein BJ742DRAFT_819799 [Cladochytrium replicatum]|nr:hypothetical protein BJ742DRAFT_819799 [Cladochytrium replicatum]
MISPSKPLDFVSITKPVTDALAAETIASATRNSVSRQLRPNALVILDGYSSIDHAMQTFRKNQIHCAPVRDNSTGEWLGLLDHSDILVFALKMATEGYDPEHTSPDSHPPPPTFAAAAAMPKHDPKGPEEELPLKWRDFVAKSADELGHRAVRFAIRMVRNVVNESQKNEFCPVNDSGTVFQVVEDVFARGVHRVPVVDESGKLTDIFSQSDVLRMLYDILHHRNGMQGLGPIAQCNIESLGLISPTVIAMSSKAQAIHGFWLMMFHKVTGIAILERGVLVGNLSASDVLHLSTHNLTSLLDPITAFVTESDNSWHCDSDHKDTSNKHVHFNGFGSILRPPVTVTPRTTFGTLIEKLAVHHVHRAYVVDDEGRPTGVVTLTRVMEMLGGYPNVSASVSSGQGQTK